MGVLRPDSTEEHVPVLGREVMEWLSGGSAEVAVDCTLGLGGHARLLLEQNPKLSLVGIDLDDENLARARASLAPFGHRVRLARASFADLDHVLADRGIPAVGIVLADLGLSTNQITDPTRGFSFERDGPLDMRLDRRRDLTAADLVNGLPEGDLADLLYLQSQERHSRRIARCICEARRQAPLNSTVLLARLVASAKGARLDSHRERIHPATRTFMALRMAVNREVDSLTRLLRCLPSILEPGGRVAIISFHSIEDRIVKHDFRSRAREGLYRVLTPKPIVAGQAERRTNPASRSAKLRVAEFRRDT